MHLHTCVYQLEILSSQNQILTLIPPLIASSWAKMGICPFCQYFSANPHDLKLSSKMPMF